MGMTAERGWNQPAQLGLTGQISVIAQLLPYIAF